MPAPPASGVWLHFRPRKWCLTPFPPFRPRKWCLTPFPPWCLTPFLILTLTSCASSPPLPSPVPAPTPDVWNGSGGAAPIRNHGIQLADFALTLRGTPYRYGGATIAGFDCSGLVFYTHRRFGLEVPRTSRDQAEQAERVKRGKLERGDLVFFRIDSRNVNHVGIYIGDDRFVHAPGKGKPVTINSLDDEYYDERFDSAGRFWK